MQYSCETYTSIYLDRLQKMRDEMLKDNPSLQCEITERHDMYGYDLTVYDFGEENSSDERTQEDVI